MKNMYRKIFYAMFKRMDRGHLIMTLPGGVRWNFGAGDGIAAEIRVHNDAFFKRCFLFGDIGFAESYMAGEWETDNLKSVIEWMILNVEHHPTLMDDKGPRGFVNILRFANQLYYHLRPNTLKGSKENIQAHYDLSNDFFRLFLDPTMTYSSAYFQRDDESLEQAQINKYDMLCKKMRLTPEDKVLEIGSGWGGFATHAAKTYGCDITTITISQKQFEHASEVIAAQGLNDRVNVRLIDYRYLKGAFDKIVSIEMIEAVGYQHLKVYFQQINRLLKKDGLLGLQMILAPDHRFDSFRKIPDFIQKHIFPGSLLPSIDVIQKNLRRTGTLCLTDFEDMTSSYVRTLLLWQQNFRNKLDEVRSLGFDEMFIRKWHYYFSYCAAAFSMRNISVAQAVFSRPNNLQLSSQQVND